MIAFRLARQFGEHIALKRIEPGPLLGRRRPQPRDERLMHDAIRHRFRVAPRGGFFGREPLRLDIRVRAQHFEERVIEIRLDGGVLLDRKTCQQRTVCVRQHLPLRERDAQAVEDGRPHVATLLVGAEQERALAVRSPERGYARIQQLQLRGVERILHGKQRRENREQEEQHGHRGREHREPGTAEGIEQVACEGAREPSAG